MLCHIPRNIGCRVHCYSRRLYPGKQQHEETYLNISYLCKTLNTILRCMIRKPEGGNLGSNFIAKITELLIKIILTDLVSTLSSNMEAHNLEIGQIDLQ